MLWSLGGSLFRSSTKLALSFVLVIVLMILGFAFAPGVISGLQDWIEVINDSVRSPPGFNDQQLILYRQFVNEATIFGIILTLISRAIIELCAWGFTQGYKAAVGDKAKPAAQATI